MKGEGRQKGKSDLWQTSFSSEVHLQLESSTLKKDTKIIFRLRKMSGKDEAYIKSSAERFLQNRVATFSDWRNNFEGNERI